MLLRTKRTATVKEVHGLVLTLTLALSLRLE